MLSSDTIGMLAASFVLLSSSASQMKWLRLCSLLSNISFVTYAALEGLAPILVLHSVLMPINALQLWRAWRCVPRQLSIDAGAARVARERPS